MAIAKHKQLKLSALVAIIIAATVSGCSSKQTQALGLRSSTVSSTPQQMSNQEICDVYVHGRNSVHTRFAVASEWNRRGLSRDYCEEKNTELFITKAVKALAGISDKKKAENANAVKPVKPVAK